MTNQELAAALRKCGRVEGPGDCVACRFYKGDDAALCIPRMTAACADALENSESHVMALQQEIERLRGQIERQWISVEERIPETTYDVMVLVSGTFGNVTFENTQMIGSILDDGEWFVNEYPEWDNPGVTHWMPLPEPPSTEGVE